MTLDNNTTPAAAPRSRLARWVAGIAGIVAIIAGGSQMVRGLNAFTLLSCESHTAITTVKSIFKEKGAELDEVSNARLISDDKDQRNCAARVRGQGETAQITYQVYWDGWSKTVRIGEVNVEAAAGASDS